MADTVTREILVILAHEEWEGTLDVSHRCGPFNRLCDYCSGDLADWFTWSDGRPTHDR